MGKKKGLTGSKKGGTAPMFTNAEELQKKIDEYYDWCNENEKPICITGLAWYLGTNRMTLLNYKNDNMVVRFKEENPEEYKKIRDVINEAYARVEFEYESFLFEKSKTVGGIFTLKNNFNWVDRQEVVSKEDNNINVDLEDVNKELEKLE